MLLLTMLRLDLMPLEIDRAAIILHCGGKLRQMCLRGLAFRAFGTQEPTALACHGSKLSSPDILSSDGARHGAIDVIVANAGIAHRVPLARLDDDKWDLTFDIDLKGIFRVVRAALPGMRTRGSGAVVALSSIMGVAYGWDEHVHYSSAKAGVVGLVRGLAVEVARDGVRVNGVAPGYIRTAQLLSEKHSLGPQGAEKAASFIPMGRVGEPEDIADVIHFLASSSARYLTGQVLTVDGGLLVGRY